jgi:hypothetical protein
MHLSFCIRTRRGSPYVLLVHGHALIPGKRIERFVAEYSRRAVDNACRICRLYQRMNGNVRLSVFHHEYRRSDGERRPNGCPENAVTRCI